LVRSKKITEIFRQGFEDYLVLTGRFREQRTAHEDRKRELARKVLAGGHMVDPAVNEYTEGLSVRFHWLCPTGLATRLSRLDLAKPMCASLQRKASTAALKALDEIVQYEKHDLPEQTQQAVAAENHAMCTAGTHCIFCWKVVVGRPEDWQELCDPHSLDPASLRRLTESGYLTVALYHLGGLADAGAPRLIVAEPVRTGDLMVDLARYAAWRGRLPVSDTRPEAASSQLSDEALPPIVAEQMLAHVEAHLEELVAAPTAAENSSPEAAATQTSTAATQKWIRSDEASRRSGLSPSTLRKRANKQGWRTRRSGPKYLCYRLEDLENAWPHKNFRQDEELKRGT
jgi:hypothetical protein